jgi:energy-converting hydrogenase Eha subunit A
MIPEQNPSRHPPGLKSAFKQLVILSINGLAAISIFLIGYGVLLHYTGEEYRIFERLANPISVVATLVGTGLTATSVYLPANKRPPEEFSKIFAAPIVLLGTASVLFIYLDGKLSIPIHVINGFALLGISGSLFRLISR